MSKFDRNRIKDSWEKLCTNKQTDRQTDTMKIMVTWPWTNYYDCPLLSIAYVFFGWPFVKRFALSYRTVVCLSCPVLSCLSCPLCDVGVLLPNGWMDQDETWHAGRPWPWPHALDGDPAPPPPKGGAAPTIFGPYLLWPNGWMNQDATW